MTQEPTLGERISSFLIDHHEDICLYQPWHDNRSCSCGLVEKVEQLVNSQSRAHQVKLLDLVRESIDENIALSRRTHRVGSHSDDYGGESDYPCDCDEKQRKYEVSALESFKKKLERIAETARLTDSTSSRQAGSGEK